MSIIVSITSTHIKVIPVPSHPIAAWYMHLWISFSMHVTVLKERVISCYVHRYITPMAWMGSDFLNYSQIRLHMVQGAHMRVCYWWQMTFAACCSRGFHLGQKIQTGCFLTAAMARQNGVHYPALPLDAHDSTTAKSTSEFNCAARQEAADAEVQIKQRFTLKSLFSWSKHAQHAIFLPRDVLDKLGIMRSNTRCFCHLKVKDLNTN